jgi:hypothetical protein
VKESTDAATHLLLDLLLDLGQLELLLHEHQHLVQPVLGVQLLQDLRTT